MTESLNPSTPDGKRLRALLAAQHPCIVVSTFEEDYVLGLLREIAIDSDIELWVWSVSQGIREGLISNSASIADTDHPAAALYYLARMRRKQGIYVMLDLAGHLKDDRTLRLLRDAIGSMIGTSSVLVLIDHHDELPPVVSTMATRFTPSYPNEDELEQLVKRTLRLLNEQQRIDVQLNRQDLSLIVRNLRGLTRRQARRIILDCVMEDHRFDASDINSILAHKRRAIGEGILQYIEAPVDLDEVGGLRNLKTWLAKRQLCFQDGAEIYGISHPRGVLMLGVQGSGKSLASKAVATAWQRPLLRLDAGSLYDRYIGESERRLRDALRQAEMMAPVVLWIDEIEKGFASAASLSSDGGLSKRMFGTLLTWMQEHQSPVFLVATANDIEALPPELLRKGRFDEIFFVDLPSLEARYQIFSIHLKKRNRLPEQFDLDALVEASAGFSGAEIEQAINAALHDAFGTGVEITTNHILNALKTSPPLSVTMAEHIAALRLWSQGRCVPAD